MKKPVGVWLVSLFMTAVSIEGLWSLRNILPSLQSLPRYVAAIGHISYVVAGPVVVLGIWRSAHSTWVAAIVWGAGSLVAAIVGPLAFGPPAATSLRAVIAMTVAVIILTSGLTWYVRRVTRPPGRQRRVTPAG